LAKDKDSVARRV